MQVQFSTETAKDARFIAHVVDQGAIPADLDKAIREGAAAARFTGASGQVFDGFAEVDGKVVRIALAGAGKKLHLFHQMWDGDRLLATGEHFLLHVSLATRRPSEPAIQIVAALERIAAAHAALPKPDGAGRAVGQRP